jgi:hypothetical protein
MEDTMLPRTIFLSRLIGLFCLIFSAAELMHPAVLIATTTSLADAPAWLFLAGMSTLLAGLAMVLGHNIWRGGAAAVVVTVVGWMAAIKGAALILLSPVRAVGIIETARYADYYYLYAAMSVVLGLYLAYAGFSARMPARQG